MRSGSPHETRDADTAESWSFHDIWLALLFLVVGACLVALTVSAMGRGLSWAIMVFIGLGGFLIGPFMLLLGISGIAQALGALRSRGEHAIMEDDAETGARAPEASRFGAELEPPDSRQDRAAR